MAALSRTPSENTVKDVVCSTRQHKSSAGVATVAGESISRIVLSVLPWTTTLCMASPFKLPNQRPSVGYVSVVVHLFGGIMVITSEGGGPLLRLD